MRCISFSILKSLLPSLDCSDICGVREAYPRLLTVAANQSKDPKIFISIILRLRSPDLVRRIMIARKYYNNNYFSTANINLHLLNCRTYQCTPRQWNLYR